MYKSDEPFLGRLPCHTIASRTGMGEPWARSRQVPSIPSCWIFVLVFFSEDYTVEGKLSVRMSRTYVHVSVSSITLVLCDKVSLVVWMRLQGCCGFFEGPGTVDGTSRGKVLKSDSINASLAHKTMCCWSTTVLNSNESKAPRKVTGSRHA